MRRFVKRRGSSWSAELRLAASTRLAKVVAATVAAVVLASLGALALKELVLSPQVFIDPALREAVLAGERVYAYVAAEGYVPPGAERVWSFGSLKISKVLIGSKQQLEALAAHPRVISLYAETRVGFGPTVAQLEPEGYPFREVDIDNEFHMAWGPWCGRGVTVAIIDTGIDYTHPDFFDGANRSIIEVLVSVLYRTDSSDYIVWIPGVNGSLDDLLAFDTNLWKQYGEPAFLDINGHGCVTPDTLVWTTDTGVVPIEQVWKKYHYRAVDTSIEGVPAKTKFLRKPVYTIGFDEATKRFVLTRIVAVHKIWYNGTVIVVKLADGTTLRLTPWHPVYVVERVRDPHTGRVEYRYVGAVKASQLLAYRSRYQNRSYFIVAPVPPTAYPRNKRAELAYFIGLVYGDGHVEGGTIDIYDASYEAVKRYEEVAKELGGDTRIWRLTNENAYRLRVYLRGFEKTYRLYIDNLDTAILSDIDLARAFIAGLFDADGYVEMKGRTPEVKIVSKNLQLLAKLRDFLREIGIDASIRSGGVSKGSKTWHLVITKRENVERFYELIKDYSRHPRIEKLRKLLAQSAPSGTTKRVIDLGWARAIAVVDVWEEHYEGWLYDFTTETHNYVGNGVVVHNTHVAGIVVGRGWASDGKYRGVAPCAKLVVIKAFDRTGSASLDACLTALEWVYDHAELYDIKILSLSWGAAMASDGRDPLSLACERIYLDKKVWIFAAAGNAGNLPTTVMVPAVAPDVIAVGAWDAYRDALAPFSSLGPTIDARMKPDVVAAGVFVVSCASRYVRFPDELMVGEHYVALSGTSMATPVVAGIAADFIEYYRYWHGRDPALKDFIEWIKTNGRRINPLYKDFITGWGIPIAPHA